MQKPKSKVTRYGAMGSAVVFAALSALLAGCHSGEPGGGTTTSDAAQGQAQAQQRAAAMQQRYQQHPPVQGHP